MSGGVDSAVAALLVKQQGFEVSGITMKVWSDTGRVADGDLSPDKNCIDAKCIADTLGIPHHIVEYGDQFYSRVVGRFLEDYVNGRTPNPCVECNKHIKFGTLYRSAMSLGSDALATGHYARICTDINGNALLKTATDKAKDQSYFLWAVDKNILKNIIFPLGEYTKPQIREIAAANGFSNAHRSDSQDICFIENGEYATFIKEQLGRNFASGDFTDIDGKAIGRHSGIINYTIGQRKGLGVAFGVPMFVGGKDASSNTVMLCTDAQLYKDSLSATDINILVDEDFSAPVRLQAKIRYRHAPATATVLRTDENTLSVKFDLPQRAIASGQSVVFYDGETVIGGGIIK